MKKGVGYRDIAKEIVNVLAKYEATVKDVECILGWLDDEMKVQPVQESTARTTIPDMDFIYEEVMSRLYETIHQGFAQNVANTEQSFQQ